MDTDWGKVLGFVETEADGTFVAMTAIEVGGDMTDGTEDARTTNFPCSIIWHLDTMETRKGITFNIVYPSFFFSTSNEMYH